MDAFETYEHKGVSVSFYYDETAGDPFEQFDQLAAIVWTDEDRARVNRNGRVSVDYSRYLDMDRFSSLAHAERYLTLMRRYLLAIPFAVIDYGSGGVRAELIREPYDDRDERILSGFLVVSEENREKVGAPMEGLRENALADWKVWKAWAQGEVYGYTAQLDDEFDSCFGFYEGQDLTYLREAANEAADAIAHDVFVNQEPADVAEVLAGMKGGR